MAGKPEPRVRRDAIVLTPEHVELRLEPAGPGSRWLALLVDWAIATGLASVGVGGSMALPGPLAAPLAVTIPLVVGLAYPIWFELRADGRTPGKRMMGLRVVDARGLPLEPAQSLVRNVARALDVLPVAYGVGALAALLDPWRRRLGDLAAGTLVIQERREPIVPVPQPLPPRWNSLRTPRLLRLARHRLGLEERELLLELSARADELEPRARYDLMEEAGTWFRRRLEIEETSLSGESLVRGLAALLRAREIE